MRCTSDSGRSRPGETRDVVLLLGQGETRAHAVALAGRFGDAEAARTARGQIERRWDAMLGAVQVETPTIPST